MITATMFQAKSDLSRLVERARLGEEVILTNGRDRTPVARIVGIAPIAKKRLGALAGKGDLEEAFFDPLPAEEIQAWDGEE